MEASHFDRERGVRVGRSSSADATSIRTSTARAISGKTWQEITRGLPAGVYVHVVKEDPMRRGLLFAGTERGVFVSFDDGDTWQSLQLNLPVTSMRDFEIYGNDLIVATHGRGFWVIDDISPLRQINDAVASADALSVQAGRRDRRAARAATTARRRRRTSRRRRIRRTARTSTTT